MAEQPDELPRVEPVERPINLIPVGLKEAALDSPTFRATTLYFADQVDLIEKWLEGYVKAAAKIVAEASQVESLVNAFLSQSIPPAQIGEAALDHDYALLALQRYSEGAREYWQSVLKSMKRFDGLALEPVKAFLNGELRSFKDARRVLEASQKTFDAVIARYASQGKTKEASSLREDAFQLHETRRAYLKASMDFCVAAPQLRTTLDKLIVRISADLWAEMRSSREASTTSSSKFNSDIARVKGWSKEMENSERAFKQELLTARKQLEESVVTSTKPSRELDDYAQSTVPYLGTGATASTGLSSSTKSGADKAEKQSWLYIRTVVGKPARTIWSRRWFFVKNGIFGWLIQGTRSGGVEESEKIGVLLCSIRPAFQEERRFCFEVKTKDQTIVLQAETQQELTDWISAFEYAKRKALEDPTSTETNSAAPGVDPAFAISPPTAPEFAAKLGEGNLQGAEGEASGSSGLSISDKEGSGLSTRASFDVNPARRVMSLERQDGEGGRDHANRIIQKLDLHKRSSPSTSISQSGLSGGIASLISASHNILPVGPGAPPPLSSDGLRRPYAAQASSLAPSTLANPPVATSLSNTAVVVSGERGIGLDRGADGSSIPSAIMANLWGSMNWGYVNRLGEELRSRRDGGLDNGSPARSPSATLHTQDDMNIMDGMSEASKELSPLPSDVLGPKHRKTMSAASIAPLGDGKSVSDDATAADEYPNYYPMPLKAQNAQFRMLFPSVPRQEKLVLVFRATWNPNDQQEFPGRVYVTAREIYIYSNHLGLVLITGISLSSLEEVTAAPGRDCDFLYLHLKGRKADDDMKRITVKIFLEPLKLLQRRLSFLVHNANSAQPVVLEEIMKTLIKTEIQEPQRSSSAESWEDITYDGLPAGNGTSERSPRRDKNVKASLRIDGSLYTDPARTGREVQKFKLPGQPVLYAPQGMVNSVTREFDVSAKALFHVMFGDKSAVFQLLYCNRWADTIVQSPWTKATPPGSNANNSHWTRRFTSQGGATPLADTQVIDILSDHLCYVVANIKTPWRLPYASNFSLTTKFVVTHVSKSKCKLAIFQQIAWKQPPHWSYVRRLIESHALHSLEADALDLSNVAMDQVAKLGHHSKTNRAVEIFGNIGQQTAAAEIDTASAPKLGGSLSLQRVKRGQAISLHRLVINNLIAQLMQAFGMILDIGVALGKGAISLLTAHTLLVVMLAVSALYNSWHGYRDSLGWYHERSASNYMSRLGVTPAPTIGRSIYLRDVEDFISLPALDNATMASFVPTSSTSSTKTCRSTFAEQLTSSTSLAVGRTRSGLRLQRTRDALAQYRHDLLVAMRVVNRVERDVVSAEWEEWLKSEEHNCAKVETMLEQQRKASGRKKPRSSEEIDAELGSDFAEYCKSCRSDAAGLSSA